MCVLSLSERVHGSKRQELGHETKGAYYITYYRYDCQVPCCMLDAKERDDINQQPLCHIFLFRLLSNSDTCHIHDLSKLSLQLLSDALV